MVTSWLSAGSVYTQMMRKIHMYAVYSIFMGVDLVVKWSAY